MNRTGWIKIHRKIQNSPMYRSLNSKQRDVLLQCLLLANHKPKEWLFNNELYLCQEGEFITSIPSLLEKCAKDVNTQNVRTALKILEKWEFLTGKSTNRNRLIKIVHWQEYQSDEDETNRLTNRLTNRQLTGNQQATNRQLTANKNVKKERIKEDNKGEGNSDREKVDLIGKYYQEKIHNKAQLTDASRKKIGLRLKEYTIEELKLAIDRFSGNKWRMENNADKGMSWFFDSNDKIAVFTALAQDRIKKPSETPRVNEAGQRLAPNGQPLYIPTGII